ncbi:MAG: putative Glycosyl hydrolase, repeat [Steroidobacteraceae bacterium]|nr:putative Glycosyl hydrolase, repeat [Steroidobacteraceae bacterium]
MPKHTTLWIGTRKGMFALRADARRRAWKLVGPQFLGHVIHHVVQDPREPRVVLAAAKTGHLGPTVFRSTDRGRTWTEARQPPAFRKATDGESLRAVDAVFWLTAGHASERGTWYAGTSPAGLFRSDDGGETWEPVAGFNDHPMHATWIQGPGSPIGQLLHSVRVDPRDTRHLYLGVSSGGVFESIDGGGDWRPLNAGVAADFLPDPDPQYGHDTHCLDLHPAHPDRLYQQNHCGIYRLDRPGERWTRIGAAMPRRVGDIGFPIVLHPTDPDRAWVFPMDGTSVWPRTSPEGKPAVYTTTDGGRAWRRLDRGLPRKQGWLTVLRQAMCADDELKNLGLYFGTTSGEIWASRNEGQSWACVARHLPQVFSVTAGV